LKWLEAAAKEIMSGVKHSIEELNMKEVDLCPTLNESRLQRLFLR